MQVRSLTFIMYCLFQTYIIKIRLNHFYNTFNQIQVKNMSTNYRKKITLKFQPQINIVRFYYHWCGRKAQNHVGRYLTTERKRKYREAAGARDSRP